jgi:hypothetical protein
MAISAGAVQIWNRALSRIGQSTRLQSVDDTDEEAAEAGRLHWEDVLLQTLQSRHWPWAMRTRQLAEITDQSDTIAYADALAPYTVFTVPVAFIDSTQLEVVHISSGGVETTLEATTDYTMDDEVVGAPRTITLAVALGAGESVRLTVTWARNGWAYIYPEPADCALPVACLPPDTRYSQITPEQRIEWDRLPNDSGDGFLIATDLAAEDFVLEYVAIITNVLLMPRLFVECLVWGMAAEFALALKRDEKLYLRMRSLYDAAVIDAFANSLNARHEAEQTTPSIAARG